MTENIRQALQGIWGHKLRSLLTMLGIIIGIAAIITIVSTIKGTNEQIKQNLIGAGNNVVTVVLNQDGYPYDMSWQGIPQGVDVISQQTREALEEISGVEKVALFTQRSYSENVFYRNTQFSGEMYGIDRNYLAVCGLQVKSGRGFTQSDFDNHRKVALVNGNTVNTLFGGESPVGKNLEIQGEVFTVVGVVALSQEFAPTISSLKEYWLYSDTSAGAVYLPDALWPAAYQFDEPQNVAIKVKNTDVMAQVGQDASELLTREQIRTSEKFDYRSQNMLEQAQQLQSMSQSTNMQLIWIASISLLVGGIGGLVGVISGIGLAQLISRMMQIPVAIDVPTIFISVLFSTLIGLVFGLLPAMQAANLNPIEALRRD